MKNIMNKYLFKFFKYMMSSLINKYKQKESNMEIIDKIKNDELVLDLLRSVRDQDSNDIFLNIRAEQTPLIKPLKEKYGLIECTKLSEEEMEDYLTAQYKLTEKGTYILNKIEQMNNKSL